MSHYGRNVVYPPTGNVALSANCTVSAPARIQGVGIQKKFAHLLEESCYSLGYFGCKSSACTWFGRQVAPCKYMSFKQTRLFVKSGHSFPGRSKERPVVILNAMCTGMAALSHAINDLIDVPMV
uniref:Uncharacterized protein n=1 Tax=Trichuris muris TaxID=70415 RepID=A0A5S6QUZ6_TRIMR